MLRQVKSVIEECMQRAVRHLDTQGESISQITQTTKILWGKKGTKPLRDELFLRRKF
jgi:hypothetical protein